MKEDYINLGDRVIDINDLLTSSASIHLYESPTYRIDNSELETPDLDWSESITMDLSHEIMSHAGLDSAKTSCEFHGWVSLDTVVRS